MTIVTPCTQDQDRGDLHSTASTPTPPTSHPGLETVVKDENGQDIVCVVCNDKSSGKHYGQFTCEGRIFDLHCNTESALIMRAECMTFLSRARGKVPLLTMLPLC